MPKGKQDRQMVGRSAEPKATATRKLKAEQSSFIPSTHQAPQKSATPCSRAVTSRLEKAISELQGLNELLLTSDVDPRILADFRDALNRVRTAAWATQQYVARKDIEQDSTSMFSFLAGERIRAAHHLCQAIGDDLKRPDIAVPAGSLIQLYEVMSEVAEQLKGIVNKLG